MTVDEVFNKNMREHLNKVNYEQRENIEFEYMFNTNQYSNFRKELNKAIPNTFDVQYINVQPDKTTVVRWADGTITYVRCSDNDTYDIQSAFCAALAKKVYGSTSAVRREVERKNSANINKKKEEERRKIAEENKKQERINHDRKLRKIAKQMRLEAEAYDKYGENV